MGVTREQLEALKETMPYKFRVQSSKYGKSTIVSYVDSRQVQDKLDEALGAENWQDEYKLIDGKLFCGIGVATEDSGWVWKHDVGVESNVDAEKGNSSDSFKRAAVKWGVGRFLYSLGIITLNAKKHTNDKEYPTNKEGKILWNIDELTAYCSTLLEKGILDDTKPYAPKKQAPAKPASNKPKEVSNTQPDKKVSLTDGKGGLTPNKEFYGDDDSDNNNRKAKALKVFSELDPTKVLAHLIKNEKLMFTSVEDFVNGTDIDKVLEIYGKVKQFKP